LKERDLSGGKGSDAGAGRKLPAASRGRGVTDPALVEIVEFTNRPRQEWASVRQQGPESAQKSPNSAQKSPELAPKSPEAAERPWYGMPLERGVVTCS